jgi:hypothetical protein
VKQAILPARGCLLKKQTGLSASRLAFMAELFDHACLPNSSSAIQQARIEAIFDRLADLDLFEIGMPGI